MHTQNSVQPWLGTFAWLRRDPSPGTVAIRLYWGCFTAVLGLTAWNALWRLGDTFVRDYDEARYGVAASEMLHGHSVLVTTYAGTTEFWNLKPPLGYWMLELSYQLVGETPLGLRLPSAVCALLTTALTMSIARRAVGCVAAIIAGIVLATSFGLMAHHGARSGDLDAPLTLLMLLFLMFAARLFDSRAARLAAGLALALGFLLKSFAILPFVAAVAVYYLITRGITSWRIWVLPLATTVITAATWAVARSVAEGSCEFVRRMFVEDLVLRSATTIDTGAYKGPWDYLGALFDRLVPWPLIVLIARSLTRRFTRDHLSTDFATLLWCYSLIPLAIFTLARTHHSHYIIPTYPAWAILAAVGTLDIIRSAQCRGAAGPMAVLIALGMVACEVRLITHMEIRDRMPASQVFLASLRARTGGEVQLLHTTFTPSYSERFFLQVVDGFTLDDMTTNGGNTRPNGVVLVKRPAPEATRAPPGLVGAAVLAQNNAYVLMRITDSPIAALTARPNGNRESN